MREPERSCVGCRKRDSKRNLLRFVLGPDGLMVEREAIGSGRGAYLHLNVSCLMRFSDKKLWARALRCGESHFDSSKLMELKREILKDVDPLTPMA